MAQRERTRISPCRGPVAVRSGNSRCSPTVKDHRSTENDTEARCGPLDPTRFDEEGNYIPLPGC